MRHVPRCGTPGGAPKASNWYAWAGLKYPPGLGAIRGEGRDRPRRNGRAVAGHSVRWFTECGSAGGTGEPRSYVAQGGLVRGAADRAGRWPAGGAATTGASSCADISWSSRTAAEADMEWLLASMTVEDGEMAEAQDPVAVMTAGSVILGHVLSAAGFTFQLTCTGQGSGGRFAVGRFTKGSQYVEFHFRYSLGLVVYGWGDATLAHADYLRGLDLTGAYPGYSADPLDGFRHLALDLAGPLRGFINGDRIEYERVRSAAAEAPRRRLP
jgi:hypothetical protein